MSAESDPIRIAVADGGSDRLDSVIEALTSAGAEVTIRDADVQRVLHVASAEHPDVILLDPSVSVGVVRPPADQRRRSPLSPRETEVLRLLAAGIHVAAISRRLGISQHTVRGHVKKILAKTGSHSQLEAVAKANARGWIVPASGA